MLKTSDANWPNPERPGVPPNPDVSGWHWVMRLGQLIAVKWDAPSKSWRLGNHSYYTGPDWVLNWEYCSPILTPTQIAEMLEAERERYLTACESAKVPVDGWGDPIDDGDADRNEGIDDAMAATRNLGAAS